MTTANTYSKTLPDLNLSQVAKKTGQVEQAVHLAAAYGYFSLLDVYRELGYKPNHSDKWYRKTEDYPPEFIRSIMKDIGIQSRKMSGCANTRANARRYFRPAGTLEVMADD